MLAVSTISHVSLSGEAEWGQRQELQGGASVVNRLQVLDLTLLCLSLLTPPLATWRCGAEWGISHCEGVKHREGRYLAAISTENTGAEDHEGVSAAAVAARAACPAEGQAALAGGGEVVQGVISTCRHPPPGEGGLEAEQLQMESVAGGEAGRGERTHHPLLASPGERIA